MRTNRGFCEAVGYLAVKLEGVFRRNPDGSLKSAGNRD